MPGIEVLIQKFNLEHPNIWKFFWFSKVIKRKGFHESSTIKKVWKFAKKNLVKEGKLRESFLAIAIMYVLNNCMCLVMFLI